MLSYFVCGASRKNQFSFVQGAGAGPVVVQAGHAVPAVVVPHFEQELVVAVEREELAVVVEREVPAAGVVRAAPVVGAGCELPVELLAGGAAVAVGKLADEVAGVGFLDEVVDWAVGEAPGGELAAVEGPEAVGALHLVDFLEALNLVGVPPASHLGRVWHLADAPLALYQVGAPRA